MPDNFLSLLVQGHYSDWVFNVLMTQITLGIKNNLTLILLIAGAWVKIARLTRAKWDDKASNWFIQKITGYKKKEEE